MLTQKRLKEIIDYCPNTGLFNRIDKKESLKVGTVGSHGYMVVKVDGKLYRAHRLVWLFVYGKWPNNQIDHIDGNKQNNILSNLRDVTRSDNMCNKNKCRSDNNTGLLGVMWLKRERKYTARIHVNGKSKSLGYFDDKYKAHLAYVEAKKKYHLTNTLETYSC